MDDVDGMDAGGDGMRIVMLVRYSPARGRVLAPGQVVDVPDEVALDLLQRGLARPAGLAVERAVGPGQEERHG